MDDQEKNLEDRRNRLGDKLAGLKVKAGDDADKGASAAASRKGFGEAMKLSSEFLSAVIVGALLGYLLDRFAGTSPWGLIILLLLGFCAGVLNVLRAVGKVSSPHPADRSPGENKK
ncbi:AtpZ/AtpI family protein [Allorhizobium undicola]|uniref:AtpZ/AtpI family protein n=1 Tax=Allorhizobium undicola TaxID=78527 RepID=UPI003D356143